MSEIRLRQAEVRELEVPPLINEDVLWLQVSVQNVVFVEVLNCEDNFSEQEFGLLGKEGPVLLDQREQISSRAQVEDEVQIILRGECLVELDDERVRVLIQSAKDVSLAEDLLGPVDIAEGQLFNSGHALALLSSHHNLLLVNSLHGKEVARSFMTDKDNLSKCSFS